MVKGFEGFSLSLRVGIPRIVSWLAHFGACSSPASQQLEALYHHPALKTMNFVVAVLHATLVSKLTLQCDVLLLLALANSMPKLRPSQESMSTLSTSRLGWGIDTRTCIASLRANFYPPELVRHQYAIHHLLRTNLQSFAAVSMSYYDAPLTLGGEHQINRFSHLR